MPLVERAESVPVEVDCGMALRPGTEHGVPLVHHTATLSASPQGSDLEVHAPGFASETTWQDTLDSIVDEQILLVHAVDASGAAEELPARAQRVDDG
jgi:hypothetical protein